MFTLKPLCSSWSPTDMIPLVFVLLVLLTKTLACPGSCICNDKVVRCRHADLTELPSGLPSDVRLLDLSENKLSHFAPGSFGHLPELTALILSDNELTEVPVFDSRNRRLERLTLAENDITELSGLAISMLTSLKALDLRDNSISDLNSTSFPKNCSVATLVLTGNKISKINDSWLSLFPWLKSLKLNKNAFGSLGTFPRLSTLQFLDLSNNQIGEVPSLAFKYLTSLKVLKLHKNGLKKLQTGSFFVSKLKTYTESKLEELHLEYNALTKIGGGAFFGLVSLKRMYIHNNQISRIDMDIEGVNKSPFDECKALQILDMSHNRLPEVNSSWFSSHNRLIELQLHHNNITTIKPDSFIQCSSLKELALYNNLLSWPSRRRNDLFNGLTSLETLHVQRNLIGSVAGPGFEDLRSLRYLNLSENPLSKLDEDVFRSFTSLQQLFLNSSMLICDCYLAWFPSWIKEMNFTLSVGGLCRRGGQNILHVPKDSFSCANHPWMVEMPQNKKANKSENVTLRCKADSQSSSPIQYIWKKNDDLLVPSDRLIITNVSGTSTLTILNVDFKDAGSYQCKAKNSFHHVKSTLVEIQVYKFPLFTARPRDTEVHEGDEVAIHCQAEGEPEPVIKLISTSGTTFPAADQHRVGYDLERGAYIRNVSTVDEGLYYCTATNLAGTATAEFRITVLPRLTVVARGRFDTSGVVGQPLVMQCNTSGLKLKGDVVWYKGDKKQQPDGHRIRQTKSGEWLVFSNLKPRDAGQYTCQLETENNRVETEYNLIVTRSVSVPGCNGSGSSGDDDATWIVISVICGVLFASASWVIGMVVWRIMIVHKKKQKQRKHSAVGSSQSERPSQHTNGHTRPITTEEEMEEGSSGSGGLPVRIMSTLKTSSPIQNGMVGGKPTARNGHRPAHRTNGACVTSQDENHSQSCASNLGFSSSVTNQPEVSPSPQEASATGKGPQVRVLSPDGSFQPLVAATDSGRQTGAAASSCNSDSDVD